MDCFWRVLACPGALLSFAKQTISCPFQTDFAAANARLLLVDVLTPAIDEQVVHHSILIAGF